MLLSLRGWGSYELLKTEPLENGVASRAAKSKTPFPVLWVCDDSIAPAALVLMLGLVFSTDVARPSPAANITRHRFLPKVLLEKLGGLLSLMLHLSTKGATGLYTGHIHRCVYNGAV